MNALLVIPVVLWVLTVVGLFVAYVRRGKKRQREFEQELSEFAAGFDALAAERAQEKVDADRRVAGAKYGRLRDGAEL